MSKTISIYVCIYISGGWGGIESEELVTGFRVEEVKISKKRDLFLPSTITVKSYLITGMVCAYFFFIL